MSIRSNNASLDCKSATNPHLYLEESEVIASFQNNPEAVIIGDLWGYISDVNQAVVELFGVKNKSEIIGKHVLNFVAKDDRARAVTNSLDAIQGSKSKTDKYRAVLKNGTELLLDVRTAFIIDKQGQKIGFIDFIKPISKLG
jgi:two-component system, NtrC family, sensor kinase